MHLGEAGPREYFDILLADEADVAVVVAASELPATADPRFEISHLLDAPLDLPVPESHRLAGETQVLHKELVDEPWVMDRSGSPYRQPCSPLARPLASLPSLRTSPASGTPGRRTSEPGSALRSSHASPTCPWATPS